MSLKIKILDLAYELLVNITGNRYRKIRIGYPVFPRTRAALNRQSILPIFHHYYEPYVAESDLLRPLTDIRQISGLELKVEAQLQFIQNLDYIDEIQEDRGRDDPFSHNMYVSDAPVYYSMIRHLRPTRIVEIGSGASSQIALLAIKRNKEIDPAYRCDLTCIEPFENPWLETIGANIVRKRVEQCDDAYFNSLERNDILFIDSTHVIRPQGDVLHEFLHILGILKPGVVVHVHDIFTPRDYPLKWILKDRKLWTEQYLLEAFLCFNSTFHVLLSSNLLYHEYPGKYSRAFGSPLDEPSSFWILKHS